MSQPLMPSGHHCTVNGGTAACRHVTRRTHENMTDTSVKRWMGDENLTKVSAQRNASDCQLRKNCNTETSKIKSSGLTLTSYTRPPLSSLVSQCERLEEVNACMHKRIMEMEDKAMKNATQQLEQYDRADSNVHAVQIWAQEQIRNAERDLELTRNRSEKRVNVLHLQLQNCEERMQETQKDLQQLQEYRDRGHSVQSLQAAELDRQLLALSELHQDRAADVEALAQREIANVLESHQKLKDDVLEGVVEQQLESVPPSLKRMCLQNQEMKSEIKAHQQMIMDLQDDIKKLLETGESLRKSWKVETDRLCKELLLINPTCPPDEDVVLNIPLNQQMYI
ncbi:hypothetical protein GDO78_015266 [Eleutherodactylus coqui]|uniref:Uncharacterized protein n=1 Tax=Eleutherodactylus coqui TaxID=57060 RepID=A0A8J6EDX1_ELECQ|nr:hypothetical protein GDO78_015266 [Eleutherodactylus coqui]